MNYIDFANESRFYNADCFDAMNDIRNNTIDMILTDLPYSTTYAEWDKSIDLDKLWNMWLRIIKLNSAVILTASQPFTSKLIMSKPKLFRCEWIWDKVNGANFANANKQPLKTHESVLIFSQEQSIYNPQKTKGVPNHKQGERANSNISETRLINKRVDDDLSGMKFPKSIQTFPKHSSQSKLHSTQKPVELFEYFINTYSNENDLILDCTAGSGTTAIAAINTKRKWICIEKEKEHFDISINRINEHAKPKS